MDIEQLRHFVRVAERQNFTRAAEEFRLSQSSLSRSISRLESELGQPVFERRPRQVVLTDAGELLFDRARRILALVDETRAELNDDGRTGKIRLGTIPTIAPYFLPELLSQFSAKYPEARISVHEETTEHLLQKTSHGELDLAVVALPISAKYLEVEPLFEEELLLVLPTEHPLVRRRQIRLKEIESLPFVLLNEAHCLSEQIVTFCRREAFHPVSIERTSQLATVLELVSLNHGVSLIPVMARHRDDSPRRVYRSLTGLKPTRQIACLTNPYRYETRLLKRFRQSMRDFARGWPHRVRPAR